MVDIIGAKKDQDEIDYIDCPDKTSLLYDPKIRSSWSIGNSLQEVRKRHPEFKIGFTNGKFRVLHPAHCVFLSVCKSQCDLLVVGLNTDYSLRLLGEAAPFSDKERAFALASLYPVDWVVFFDEEDPYYCISSVDPDFVFKGPDYKDKEVVSAGRRRVIIDMDPEDFPLHSSDILKEEDKQETKYFQVD